MASTKYKDDHPEKVNRAPKGKNHPMFGKHHTEESKEKNRKAHMGVVSVADTWLITFPDEHKETIQNLNEFCRNNNLNRVCMSRMASGINKSHKGFKCEKVLTATV